MKIKLLITHTPEQSAHCLVLCTTLATSLQGEIAVARANPNQLRKSLVLTSAKKFLPTALLFIDVDTV